MYSRALLGVLVSFVFATSCSAKARVTFKETENLCEKDPGVRSFAGYVRLPAGAPYALYEQNIFFWFFEARNDPQNAPLTVWLQGGPAMASTAQALGGNGPCRVLGDSETTENNEFSWNSLSNMLYIDQPVQTGFSYDTPTPGRVNLTDGYLVGPGEGAPPFIDGTFGSRDMLKTDKTTAQAAETIWDFMQVWMAEGSFSDYHRDEISIWTQSYGGHWAPGIATHFANKTPGQGERAIGISNIGIFNGISDFLVQGVHIPDFSRENTYGIEVFSEEQAQEIRDALEKPGGCGDQTVACQEAAITLDPANTGLNPVVWGLCLTATMTCLEEVWSPIYDSGLHSFDITHEITSQFPAPYANGFLNREWVQERLGLDIAEGAAVNYTYSNIAVFTEYVISGDYLRKDFRLQLGELLDQGVSVTLAYGDRDFAANWFGGEALSLAIPYSGSADFAAAGYADFKVDGKVVGKTRQAGLLSFTRVFQAGHEVPYYKPKESLALFTRAHGNKDIPKGNQSIANFVTKGPSDVRDVRAAPEGNEHFSICYVHNAPLDPVEWPGQCSPAQLAGLADGTAVVENFIVA